MGENSAKLRALDSRNAPYVQSVIQQLESLLETARRGEIAEFFSVVTYNTDRTFQVVASRPHDRLEAIARLEALKLDIYGASNAE